MSFSLGALGPCGSDLPSQGGIVGKPKTPVNIPGCDLPDESVNNVNRNKFKTNLPQEPGMDAGKEIIEKKVNSLLKAMALAKKLKTQNSPCASLGAYVTPDFGYGPGVMPGSTGMWAVPPMTPGFPDGGIMM